MVQLQETLLPDVKILTPAVYRDDRGFFFESYNERLFSAAIGQTLNFVQDNHSRSIKNVLRGLHYQLHQPQGKLVRVIVGEVYDVVVDLRQSSASFGCWVGIYLSADNRASLWIPQGFAHGFLALTDHVELLYKTTDYYDPASEQCLKWDDAELNIDWPYREGILVSPKDSQGQSFKKAAYFK